MTIHTIKVLGLFSAVLFFTACTNDSNNETENLSSTAATNVYTGDIVGSGLALTVENVNYYNASHTGYLAEPSEGGPYPGLVLIHEWWGLNDNVRSLADDFARQGYVVLAVDMYGAPATSVREEAQLLATSVQNNMTGAFNNLESAVNYLQAQENVHPGKLGTVGWCFGGGWAYQMAKNDMDTDVSVMYYGRFNPDDDLQMMRADILGHFGEEDTSIQVDTVREFQAKLQTLNGSHAVYIYPNAGHGFANESSDNYDEEAAQLAWSRTLDFLNATLKNE